MKSVKTLIGVDFDNACHELARKVIMAGFEPDIIIGVKSGGDVLGRIMSSDFPNAYYTTVDASRPGSTTKKTNGSFLSKLPYFITNAMRIVESYVLSMFEHGDSERDVRINFDEKCKELLNKSGCKILIIDDAIDSGATLRQVKGKLLGMYPECCCISAVMTVTVPTPAEKPDFRLFSNKLIRFPWSTDLKR